jgi:TRAP-type mannitol/chloroaromatic compound transport system permease large subunit
MDFVDIIVEYLPIFMFLTMGVLLFIGYPVGFILGGVAITYGFIGYLLEFLKLQNFLTLYHECGVSQPKT